MDTELKNAQKAYRLGFVNHYIAKGASKNDAVKIANTAVSALTKAAKRRESIRNTIAAQLGR